LLFTSAHALFPRCQFLVALVLPAVTLLTSRWAQAQTVYIGNSLTVTNGAPDGGAALVILGQYSTAGPLAASSVTLPTGVIQDVKFYGRDYDFTLYALTYD
jgi:hypothetical protein